MFRSEAWLAAVRTLGYCVRCGAQCRPDPCHRNEGKGMGIKADDCATWAGCRKCHMLIDQGRGLTRDERRSESDRCIVLTIIELARRGILDVNKAETIKWA